MVRVVYSIVLMASECRTKKKNKQNKTKQGIEGASSSSSSFDRIVVSRLHSLSLLELSYTAGEVKENLWVASTLKEEGQIYTYIYIYMCVEQQE